jgi:SAM-dependent methyltransferase
VSGDFNPSEFLQKGSRLADDIMEGIAAAGCDQMEFGSVLDFGCGCGRVLGYLRPKLPRATLYGADIDAALVSWMHANYRHVAVERNPFHPPSPFSDKQFNLIYGISVFTHLDESFQDEWLAELQRIAAPKALLLLSIHGETCDPPDIKEMREKGFVYKVFKTGFYKLDGLPDFYQSAWHMPSYIRSHWTRWFEVIDIIPKRINNHQDLVILRRR